MFCSRRVYFLVCFLRSFLSLPRSLLSFFRACSFPFSFYYYFRHRHRHRHCLHSLPTATIPLLVSDCFLLIVNATRRYTSLFLLGLIADNSVVNSIQ